MIILQRNIRMGRHKVKKINGPSNPWPFHLEVMMMIVVVSPPHELHSSDPVVASYLIFETLIHLHGKNQITIRENGGRQLPLPLMTQNAT